MYTLKTITLALMLIIFSVAGLRAAEISVEQFETEFFTALQAKNFEKIGQLLINNPNTAKQFQEVTRADKKSIFLTVIGIVYNNLGQYQTSLDYHKQALTINREIIKNRYGEGVNLGGIGLGHANLGQYQIALDYYQKALAIFREIKNRHQEGGILSNIGNVYNDLGQYQTALDYYQQALTIFREIKNRDSEGMVLDNIGMVYNNLNQYQTALDYFRQSLTIARKIKNRYSEGTNLNNIGVVYNNLDQYQISLDYHQQALTIDREISNRRGEAGDLTNIGAVYANLGQYQIALDYYQKALIIDNEIGNQHGEGNDLHHIGNMYQDLGQYQTALEYLRKALKIRHEIKDKRGEGANLGNIGVVYKNLGQYQTALDYYQQALTINREVKNRHEEGNNLNNIGRVWQILGKYQTALDYHQQALTIYFKIRSRRGKRTSLGNIGDMYQDLGQYQIALDYHQQALTIDREIGNRLGEADDLTKIGMVYNNLGQYQIALDYYKKALAINREFKDRSSEGNTLNNIGTVYGGLGQYKTALDYYKQALTISRETNSRYTEGNALGNIGKVYQILGQYQTALDYQQQALTIHSKIGSNSLWIIQCALAFTETKLNQYDVAIQHYEQSFKNIEKLRVGITEKEQKLSFVRDKLCVYDEFIALLQFLHSKYPKKGYDRKAIEIFEYKQGRIFLEEMGKSSARFFADLPKEILQSESKFNTQLAETHKNLVKERSKPGAGLEGEVVQNQKLINKLEQRKQKLQTKLEVLQEDIKTNYPDYYTLKYPKPVNLEILQKKVLQPNELMLIYNVREEATDLWVVDKEHFALFTIPLTEAQMQQQVTKFRDVGIESMLSEIKLTKERKLKDAALMRHLAGAVEENLPDFVETSYALYQQLLPKAVRELIAKAKPSTLYIVPTSALYSLPFESLVTEPDEDEPHYLLQDYAIAYLSSASLLKTLRDAQHRRELTEREPLLAFADPVYPQDKSCQELSQGDSIKGLRTRAYQKLLGGEGACFPALPETADEVKAIAKLFKVKLSNRPKPLNLQEDASVETVQLFNEDKELDDFQYVLFSTHAILPDEVSYIKQPALVLSHPEQNGYLKMADVFGLKMNADFVTLSACNTGRGDAIKGEGVRGLTRAFMYAGTPAVAVTLWSVESLASQQLGIHFFTQLKNKQPLAKGLRQAKLAMLENDKSHSRHPYFWAGFVVFGDGL
jgi:tetratricopeptide (TPR) repeat protein